MPTTWRVRESVVLILCPDGEWQVAWKVEEHTLD
jgi:hypothetical protein